MTGGAETGGAETSGAETGGAETGGAETMTVSERTIGEQTDAAAGPRSRGRAANDAWEALLTAHAALMRHFAAGDMWCDISMREYDVLYTLAKCAHPARQSELERHVLLSQPAISRLTDRLVARGLVAKETDPTDGRAVLLALTDSGRAVQRRIGARHARDVARIVGGRLTSTELAELGRLSRRLAGEEQLASGEQ